MEHKEKNAQNADRKKVQFDLFYCCVTGGVLLLYTSPGFVYAMSDATAIRSIEAIPTCLT